MVKKTINSILSKGTTTTTSQVKLNGNGNCDALIEFYENAEIFITGGSGVVGKALIEKLLRSCNVRKIFLLLRPRKNLSVEQRLEKLKTAKVFNVLREQCPEQLQKLVAIVGDVSEPLLGISPEASKSMVNVSIVFHCAATVRFDEPLKMALTLNVGGTHEALKFAETLRQLKIFMHVSTFFSNPYLDYVAPHVYKTPIDWRLCMQLLKDSKDEETMNALTRKIIMGFPNTYTFTKNLAESLVQEYAIERKLPVAIYRPSIVLFALREPVPGFAPSLMGAMGLFSLVGAGILKTVYLADDSRLDITPQDVGIKLMMHYAFDAYKLYQNNKSTKTPMMPLPPVYQSSSCNHAPHGFKLMASQMDTYNLWQDHAFEKSLMIPGCTYTSSRLLYMFLLFTKQIFPALIVDFLLILFGRKPIVMSIVRKAFITLEVMQPFMFNNYESPGTCQFDQVIEEYAGTEFDLKKDYQNITSKWHMVELCVSMVRSIRRDLLNEDPSTIPRAQIILKVKRALYFMVRTYLMYITIKWLLKTYF